MSIKSEKTMQLLHKYFQNNDQIPIDQLNTVVIFLKQYLSNATDEELIKLLKSTDPIIIQLLSILIELDNYSKPVIDKLTKKIRVLQKDLMQKKEIIVELNSNLSYNKNQVIKIASKVNNQDLEQNQIYIAIIHELISSTYNPRLFLMVKRIYYKWEQTGDFVSRLEIQKELGQNRVIKSFNDAFLLGNKGNKLAQLIDKLVIQRKINKKIFVKPTDICKQVMSFERNYYSKEAIQNRFLQLIKCNKLNNSRKLLLEAISKYKGITNSSKDKQKLLDYCNLRSVDNLSRYIIEMVKLGIIQRVPLEFSNDRYTLRLFDINFIKTCMMEL